ncbi:hypothetical protein HYX13_04230 [Candidatus Woesearchaeota archaeon]|nr:hypothetical protein [Candidatus Woesearchaeota archaeon]
MSKPHKELAGNHLPDKPSMCLYGGYILNKILPGNNEDVHEEDVNNDEDDGCSEYRFRLYVPTTIFDPKRAVIKVYRMESALHQTPEIQEEVVATEYVRQKKSSKRQ